MKLKSIFNLLVVAALMLSWLPATTVTAQNSTPPPTDKDGSTVNAPDAYIRIEGDPVDVEVENDGQMGAWYQATSEYFGTYGKGSVLFIDGAGYDFGTGPAKGCVTPNQFTPVSHTQVDPFTIETVYDAGSLARVTQRTEYTNGLGYYKMTWTVQNISGGALNNLKVLHGGDTTFQGDDAGRTNWDADLRMVYIYNEGVSGIMGLYGDVSTPVDHYFGGDYSCGTGNWQHMVDGSLPDTVDTNFIDAGYSVEWDHASLDAGESWVVVGYEKFTAPSYVQVYAPAGQTGNPGNTLNYTFVVQNLTAGEVTYDLAAVSSNGWGVSLPGGSTATIGAGATANVQADLTLGATCPTTDNLTLTATSQAEPTQTNSDVVVTTIECAAVVDADGDGILDVDEDIDGDGDPANDDTDGDGTPNYLDTDDDNDGIPTLTEGVADTDLDGLPDYLEPNDVDTDDDGNMNYNDPDDDGDGIPTSDEDTNVNGNWFDDDADGDGTPDFLDAAYDGISVSVTELTATQPTDTITEQYFEICNTGGLPMTYTLSEMPVFRLPQMVQVKNQVNTPVALDVPVSDISTGNTLSEPNTSRKVAIGMDGTIYVVYHGSNGVRVSRSIDGGNSFLPSVQLSAGDYQAEITLDLNGDVYVAWSDGSNAYVSRSTDGGASFGAPVNSGSPGSASVHIDTDAPYVYVMGTVGSPLLVSGDNGQTFTATNTGLGSTVFADVHVNKRNGDVFVLADNPQLYITRSTDHGATFGTISTPTGNIYYSTYATSFSETDWYGFVSGLNADAYRIDLQTNGSTLLTFGNNTVNQSRSLGIDNCSQVVDGYTDGISVYAAASTDLGNSFGPAVTVGTSTRLSVAVDPVSGEVVVVYESGGQIYASEYDMGLSGCNPNGGPTAYPQTITTTVNTPVAITLVATDPESDPLTYNVSAPAHGALSGTAPNLTYTPVAGYIGPDSFTFTANDGSNDSNVATVSIVVEAGPVTGIPWLTETPISGTIDPGTCETITVTFDSTGLADGTYLADLVIESSDPVSPTITIPVTLNVVSDVTPPDAPIILTPADGTTITDSTPTFSGTAEPGSTVTVSEDGVVICTAVADLDGNWSCDATTPLADGPHDVDATATDAAGNESEPATVSFDIDTTAPAAPIVITPADGSVIADTTPTFSGTAEPGSTITVEEDGVVICTAVTDAEGNWSCDATTPMSEGEHDVEVTATDGSGNESPVAPVGFVIDSVAPAAPVILTPTDGSATNDTTPTFGGTAEPGSTVTVMEGAVVICTAVTDVDGNWTCDATTPMSEGDHTISATATDATGNESPAAETVTFTIDATAPDMPVIITPAEGASLTDTTPTFSGTAEAGSLVTVEEDGVVICTAVADVGGNWSCDATTPMSEGPHTVAVTATDLASNVSTPPVLRNFTIDATAPAAPTVDQPAEGALIEDTTPTFSGTAEPGSTVTVEEDGVVICTAVADAEGNWTCTPTTPLSTGPHTVEVTATDAAGNVSTPAVERSFVIKYAVDLAVTMTYAQELNVLTYTVKIVNNGPDAAMGIAFTDTVPVQMQGLQWTCAGISGAVCSTPSGSAYTVEQMLDLPAGGEITIVIVGNLEDLMLRVLNTAWITLPVEYLDADLTDNMASLYNGYRLVAPILVKNKPISPNLP